MIGRTEATRGIHVGQILRRENVDTHPQRKKRSLRQGPNTRPLDTHVLVVNVRPVQTSLQGESQTRSINANEKAKVKANEDDIREKSGHV